jgi:uncharacterized protein YndB with AHSA1/START domain
VPEVVNTATIAAPAERIFDFISHAERNVEWVPDLASSERVTPGVTQRGSRFRFVIRFAGIPVPVEVTDEVTEFDPPRLIRFTGVQGVRHAGYWEMEALAPAPDGRPQTRVTYSMTFDLPPAVGPLVAKLINLPARLEEQSLACLANLRRRLEH